MKILLINNFDYIRGGSDSVFIETAKLLSEKGHEVAIFTARDMNVEPMDLSPKIQKYFTEDIFSNSKINTIKKSLYFLKNSIAQSDLQHCIDEFNPNIIHLHIFQSRLSSFIIRTVKSNNIPMVMSVHEYKILCPAYHHLDGENKICEKCNNLNYTPCITNRCVDNSIAKSTLMAIESYSRDLFTSYLNNIEKFIMVSKFIQNKHTFRYHNHADKFTQIYNFVDSKKYKTDYNFGNYLLYFGRLSKEKGLTTLLKVAKVLPHITFKIAGRGGLEALLRNYVDENHLKNVEFIGFQSSDDLLDLIKFARFTIAPSECYETLGMNIIESFCLQTPVIGANIGGIPELIIDNETGYLFNSKDKIDLEKVIKKAWNIFIEEHIILSGQARKYALQMFDKEKHYQELSNVYQSIL
jgi:glycosyltransferase involved in cell wall biosynthesis